METIGMTAGQVKEAVKHKNIQHTEQDMAIPVMSEANFHSQTQSENSEPRVRCQHSVEQPHKLASNTRQSLQN